MKPHSMFFDDCYTEHYFRKATVDDFYYDADCVVVVGTALATSYAKRIILDTLWKEEVPVIEVNMEPAVTFGHTYQVVGKCEETLPRLFDSFFENESLFT